MFSITKTYTDYNGVEKTETFWFNLNKAELAKLTLGPRGGLEGVIEEITRTTDVGRILDLIKEILLMSYGRKTPDGRFAKKDADGHSYALEFEQTVAFDDIYIDLFNDVDSLIAFINGVVPAQLEKDVATESKKALDKIHAMSAASSASSAALKQV